MKNIFTALVLLFIYCKNSKTDKNNANVIIGNWYIESNTIAESFDYQEIYIDNSTIYIFTASNYAISFAQEYLVYGPEIYYLSDDRKDTLFQMKIMVRDKSLVLKNNKGKIVYKKVNDSGNLSDYIEKVISKEDYDKNFTKRMNSFLGNSTD